MTSSISTGLRIDAIQNTVLGPIAEAAIARSQALPDVTYDTINTALATARSAIGFREALSCPGRRFILEVKSASPSLGIIRTDLDLHQYATIYSRFADAVSVLTEPTMFNGSFERLAHMRALTTLPILAKDVFVSERQILAARAAGADAVLLMLSVLKPETCVRLTAFARRLGLDVLTEASEKVEVLEAVHMDAKIIGINHRNLRDLTIDLERSARLAGFVPEDRILVAESGIRNHSDVERIGRVAQVLLVGTALNQADDLSLAVRKLVFGEMKVCGITRPVDAVTAAQAGFSAAGVVLCSRSPRAVPVEQLSKLATDIKLRTQTLGLEMPLTTVIDANDTGMIAALRSPLVRNSFSALQIHGDVTNDDLNALHADFPEKKLHLATSLPDAPARLQALARRLEGLLDDGIVDRILVDGTKDGITGGSGQAVPIAHLRTFRNSSRIRLAGGLHPANAREAAATGVAGLDANSGVELSPGIKSKHLLEAFASSVRGNPDAVLMPNID